MNPDRLPLRFLQIRATLISCGILVACAVAEATPPESLAGLVYRDEVVSSTRVWEELSLDLSGGSQFSSFLWSRGSTVSASLLGYNAPIAGGYSHEKTGDMEYRLVLSEEATGSQREFTLTFESDISSRVNRRRVGSSGFGEDGVFWLTPGRSDEHRTLVNVSARVVTKPDEPTIVGFVIPGTRSREVLIRVIGPALGPMGVSDFSPAPTYRMPGLHRSYQTQPDVSSVDHGTWSWSAEAQATIERASARCGAFPLAPDSRDLADVKRLPPGAHTIVVMPPQARPAGQC